MRTAEMDALPRVVFPASPDESHVGDGVLGLRTDNMKIPLPTDARDGKAYALLVPKTRPEPSRTVSTPPNSPTTLRSYALGPQSPPNMHSSGAITPPPTPTTTVHGKSDFGFSWSETLRRGGSVSSQTRPEIDIEGGEKSGSTEPLRFAHWLADYEIQTDGRGKKKLLGSGYWSDVYLATPCLPTSPAPTAPIPIPTGQPSPPTSPVHSRNSSFAASKLPSTPQAYAIKTPALASAKKVLKEEARILSFLSRSASAEKYLVPFYGQDTRTEALVLKRMNDTLERWMQTALNTLSEADRTQKLALIFPAIAAHLLNGLQWLHGKGCTHADIKPANILVSHTASSPVPHVVYTDFSSALLPTPHSPIDTLPTAPLGGGTWDFLDPALLTSATAATSPSASSDLWSLALTLLVLVLGASPFEAAAANVFQRREMVKLGQPLACAAWGDDGPRNVRRMTLLGEAVGWDVKSWFGEVLVKDGGKRVGVGEWRAALGGVGEKGGSKI